MLLASLLLASFIMKPIVIIGVGNLLMGDEGVGIHACKKLRQLLKREDCEIIDAGVPSMALLHMLEGHKLAFIIDCADFGGDPGEIEIFTPDEVNREDDPIMSLHSTDLLSTLDVAKKIGMDLPQIWIVGIEPSRIEQSMELSEDVSNALLDLPELIENIIDSSCELIIH